MKTNKLKMKQRILKGSLMLTLIFVSYTGNAQFLNIKGGVNMSTINFFDTDGVRYYQDGSESYSFGDNEDTYSVETKNIYGWNAGLTYEFESKRRVSFETGFEFKTRGFRYESINRETYGADLWLSEYKDDLKIHYLDIPVTMKFNFINNGLRIYGNAGLFAGFALLGKESQTHHISYMVF